MKYELQRAEGRALCTVGKNSRYFSQPGFSRSFQPSAMIGLIIGGIPAMDFTDVWGVGQDPQPLSEYQQEAQRTHAKIHPWFKDGCKWCDYFRNNQNAN